MRRLRIIVVGYLVRGPLGGRAWCPLQHVLGLARLGHDVYFLEDSGDSPWACYDPSRYQTGPDPTFGLKFAARLFERFDLGERWAYHDALRGCWHGPQGDNLRRLCRSSDLLIQVGAASPLRDWMMGVPLRVLIDLDPGFTQARTISDPYLRQLVHQHNVFFTIGENIGRDGCSIPDDGLPWQPARQPVVLNAWQPSPGPPDGKFTTIMQWDSYPAVELEGRRFCMKSESFTPYLDLPRRAGRIFQLGIGSKTAPLELLRHYGWDPIDPQVPTRDPWSYQRYIRQSKAEFGIAKHGYVVTGSGWFSERSANYLASGRPVLVQDTGFTRWLETGIGVVAFTTPDEALAGIEDISARYESHCRAARDIAVAYFDSRTSLGRLIERVFQPSPVPAP